MVDLKPISETLSMMWEYTLAGTPVYHHAHIFPHTPTPPRGNLVKPVQQSGTKLKRQRKCSHRKNSTQTITQALDQTRDPELGINVTPANVVKSKVTNGN